MREINFGEKIVGVKATALTLLFYKQEFGKDVLGDLMSMEKLTKDPNQLDSVVLLQIGWAMAKTYAGGKGFPSFYTWLEELGELDLSDKDVLVGIMEGAASGLFRGKQIKGESAGKRKH